MCNCNSLTAGFVWATTSPPFCALNLVVAQTNPACVACVAFAETSRAFTCVDTSGLSDRGNAPTRFVPATKLKAEVQPQVFRLRGLRVARVPTHQVRNKTNNSHTHTNDSTIVNPFGYRLHMGPEFSLHNLPQALGVPLAKSGLPTWRQAQYVGGGDVASGGCRLLPNGNGVLLVSLQNQPLPHRIKCVCVLPRLDWRFLIKWGSDPLAVVFKAKGVLLKIGVTPLNWLASFCFGFP